MTSCYSLMTCAHAYASHHSECLSVVCVFVTGTWLGVWVCKLCVCVSSDSSGSLYASMWSEVPECVVKKVALPCFGLTRWLLVVAPWRLRDTYLYT